MEAGLCRSVAVKGKRETVVARQEDKRSRRLRLRREQLGRRRGGENWRMEGRQE